jgi:hypothetical protein
MCKTYKLESKMLESESKNVNQNKRLAWSIRKQLKKKIKKFNKEKRSYLIEKTKSGLELKMNWSSKWKRRQKKLTGNPC